MKKKEYFFIASLNRDGIFEESYTLNAADTNNNYNLLSFNSFYIPKRNQENLHTLYYLFLDLDGWKYRLPLSILDIIHKFHELGFDESPSLIIRTSEGRFHVLLKLEPMRAFPDKISYWKKCARGLCNAFNELGADYQASSNPAGFYRVPDYLNEKCQYEFKVEKVFSSESVFRLDEIHEILIENSLVNKTKTKKSVKEMITRLEDGVPEGVRNKSCFTLAIYYKDQGITEDETLTSLLAWNSNYNQVPMEEKEVLWCVKSAFKCSYKPSEWHLRNIIESIEDRELNPNKYKEKPKKISKIDVYKERITNHLSECKYEICVSQRALAKALDIPWSSFGRTLNAIPNIKVVPTGKGRGAKTKIKLLNDLNGK